MVKFRFVHCEIFNSIIEIIILILHLKQFIFHLLLETFGHKFCPHLVDIVNFRLLFNSAQVCTAIKHPLR